MTVEELIEELKKHNSDEKVVLENVSHDSEVSSVSNDFDSDTKKNQVILKSDED
jgi:hypothetical protein